jgi:RNA polymerase sigma-70 factor (ECF subfamily)
MEPVDLQMVVPGARSWAEVRSAQPDAMDALFARWMGDVLQWCRRLGGPTVDPDQAAQDVYIVVLQRIHTVERPGQLPSWLFAVTRRVLAQHRRKAWVRRWVPGLAPDGPDPRPGPSAAAGLSERARLVHALLAELPEELREVLVLCDVEERSDPEVADMLGLKVGTAKSRLRRARMRFRELALARGLGLDEVGT